MRARKGGGRPPPFTACHSIPERRETVGRQSKHGPCINPRVPTRTHKRECGCGCGCRCAPAASRFESCYKLLYLLSPVASCCGRTPRWMFCATAAGGNYYQDGIPNEHYNNVRLRSSNTQYAPAAVHRVHCTDVLSKGWRHTIAGPAICEVQTAQELKMVHGVVLGSVGHARARQCPASVPCSLLLVWFEYRR
jgi:hypothetical protein